MKTKIHHQIVLNRVWEIFTNGGRGIRNLKEVDESSNLVHDAVMDAYHEDITIDAWITKSLSVLNALATIAGREI